MTPNQPLPSGGETLAVLLRDLALRSYAVLKQGRAENDAAEVRSLLAVIGQSRLMLDGTHGDELRIWLDELEGRLGALLAPMEGGCIASDFDMPQNNGVGVA